MIYKAPTFIKNQGKLIGWLQLLTAYLLN